MDRACPSLSRLLGMVLGEVRGQQLAALERHVQECPACRTDLENLRAAVPGDTSFLAEPAPDIVKEAHRPRGRALATPIAGPPSAGDLCVACSADGSLRRLVLLVDSPDEAGVVTAAMVSSELEMASDRDAILSSRQSTLGYPLMVEAWNQFPIGYNQCCYRLGRIEFELVRAIRRLGGVRRPRRRALLAVGPRLADPDDPRAEFQLQEAAFARRLAAFLEEALYLDSVLARSLDLFLEEYVSVATTTTLASADRCWLLEPEHLPPTSTIRLRHGILRMERVSGDSFSVCFEAPSGRLVGLAPKEATRPRKVILAGVQVDVPSDFCEQVFA
ncbi:MAG: hypothetical protein AB1609_16200 [Bacillota bacterium]